MKVFINITVQEIILLWRDRTFQVLAAILLILTGYTVFSSTAYYKHANEEHRHLTDTVRHLFENQKPSSAHMAGHYGHIVFKPATFLQAIDPGVGPFTGTTIRMEAHRQNEAVYSAASGQSSLVRFGEFSFSLLLQVVFPLLILFTCYRAIIHDRLNGTLKLIISQGVSMRKLISAKIAAYTTVYWLFLLMAAIVYAVVFSVQGGESGAGLFRIFALLFIYGVYYALLIALTVYFSARATNPSGLLAGLLAAWFVLTIIIPKSAANIGSQQAPLPTRFEFVEKINNQKPFGINGHDRNNPYTVRFIDSVMKAHNADSATQLPVKIGGLLMQADEDFNNQLYDSALEEVNQIIASQNRIGSLAAFIDPFMAIKNLSMATAGTDMYHHFHFTEEAENYRRSLIGKLNEQDGAWESQLKDERGRLKPEFWKQTEDFKYQSPSLRWSLQNYTTEIVALLAWIAITFLIIGGTSNKIKIA